MKLYELERGATPLLIDIPHAGTYLPPDVEDSLTVEARTAPDTDWHVEKLYAFAVDRGVTLLQATHSRIVVDLNRDPAGVALYPGADNTELCPTRTFANEAIYAPGRQPDADAVAMRKERYFAPYHAVLAEEIERIRQRHGFAILLDGHSIRGEVPRFFSGQLPDFNLGTAGGASCDPAVQSAAASVLAAATGFSHVVNGRFTGGFITRHYGRPDQGLHALQLEMAQRAYMDEVPPFRWEPAQARPLIAVLEGLVDALLSVQPSA